MDTEGIPTQELAALLINRMTHTIEDVFHAYAYTEEDDYFSRKHIHGLNKDFLKAKGFPNEDSLLSTFKTWLHEKDNPRIYANGGQKESKALDMEVNDFCLLPWAERRHAASHKVALRFKELAIPILNRHCHSYAHNQYACAPSSPNPLSFIAKARHGYHCALYDVLELYYECIML